MGGGCRQCYNTRLNFKDMQDYNKKNLILFGILVAVGLTVLSTVIFLSARYWWSAILPVVAIGYGIYAFVKTYLPLTK